MCQQPDPPSESDPPPPRCVRTRGSCGSFPSSSGQFSSVDHMCPDSATPCTAARQASLSITNSQSLPNSCPLSW